MNINYKVIRSNRKTISIQISPLNEVTVRVPQKTPIKDVEKFVKSKQSWINKKITANERNIIEKNQVINYKKIYVCGNFLNLEFGNENKLFANKLTVRHKNQIKGALIEYLAPLFLSEYEKICATCNLSAKTVSFKSYKARWGCCDGYNNVIFNYKLLMLPVSSWHYVIIHELCHTVHHNHSKNFWNLVSRFCKNYKKERQVLKQFAFIANFYN